jgi:hypothetical protein
VGRCGAINLSSGGVFLQTAGMDLPKHTPLDLFFALGNKSSNVVRLHRVSAIVARAVPGGVGMMFCGNSNTRQRRHRPDSLPRLNPKES